MIASNLGPSTGYKVFDSTEIGSRSGAPVQIVGVRDFVLQHNQTSEAGELDFDQGATIPSNRITDESTDVTYRFVVAPTADGTLGSDPRETVRVGFLADVTTAPQE